MHYGVILSWAFFAIIVLVTAVFVIQGEIAVSLSQFWSWLKPRAWAKLRSLRHLRRLVNVPFHIYLHRRTRNMPFALGQVWAGVGKTVRVIGKASNGDWVLELTEHIQGVESSAHFRERVWGDILYLYEWDQSINYIPTIDSICGMKAVVLKRY